METKYEFLELPDNPIHFITYGDKLYEKSKERLVNEAIKFGLFSTITAYGPDDIPKDFEEKYKDILSKPRGGGYWIWRPPIILKKLNQIDDGDYLIYLDAGCQLINGGQKRFLEYINMLQQSKYGIMSFQMPFVEYNWTSSKIFEYFNLPIFGDEGVSQQSCGGILVMRKNEHLMKIMNHMMKIINDDVLLFTDFYQNNHKGFIENRHDQSIISILRKIHGSVVIPDESDSNHFQNTDKVIYPFRATRLKD